MSMRAKTRNKRLTWRSTSKIHQLAPHLKPVRSKLRNLSRSSCVEGYIILCSCARKQSQMPKSTILQWFQLLLKLELMYRSSSFLSRPSTPTPSKQTLNLSSSSQWGRSRHPMVIHSKKSSSLCLTAWHSSAFLLCSRSAQTRPLSLASNSRLTKTR